MSRCILLSGGIDSMSLAFWLKPEHAITFDYGQVPATAEIHSSSVFCESLGLQHEVVRIDCSDLGLGDLCSKERQSFSASRVRAPTPEWWPFRNQLLITFASAKAIAIGVDELYVGAVKSDSTHRDGSSAFYRLMSQILQLQEGSLALHFPAIQMESEELVKRSGIPISLLAWSHSCHRSNVACGRCRGCAKHLRVTQTLFPL